MAFFDLFRSTKTPTSKVDYSKYFELAKAGSSDYEVFSPGDLTVSSGSISVCDPLAYIWHVQPLDKPVSPGTYPVKVLVSKNSMMSERYAFALLELKKGEVFKWELAITSKQRGLLPKLKTDEFYGFPVDAGMGCFVDAETQSKVIVHLESFLEKNDGANIYDDYFAPLFKRNAKNLDDPNDVGDWLNYAIPDTNENIIMFQSGFGDGLYPAYWGLTKENEILSLLIDFLVIENDAQ